MMSRKIMRRFTINSPVTTDIGDLPVGVTGVAVERTSSEFTGDDVDYFIAMVNDRLPVVQHDCYFSFGRCVLDSKQLSRSSEITDSIFIQQVDEEYIRRFLNDELAYFRTDNGAVIRAVDDEDAVKISRCMGMDSVQRAWKIPSHQVNSQTLCVNFFAPQREFFG